MRTFGFLLVILLLAAPAVAHPVPFSYLDVLLQPGMIEGSLTVHIYDLAHDLQITPMERLLDSNFVTEQETAIHNLLTPRFGVATDGHERILDKQPKIMHERTPLIIGSKDEVERVLSFGGR